MPPRMKMTLFDVVSQAPERDTSAHGFAQSDRAET